MKKNKKIGLALGAGSSRGLSHIGVLSVLEKNGIRPDFVAGTSIGAAVGALYCSGITPQHMKRLAITTEWQDLLDFTIPKTGIISGNKAEDYIQSLTNNCNFSELMIPLKVVATDVKNADKVVFSEGNVARAVRASISIPGVFQPVIIGKRELVDGGLVDPIPIDVLKDMGAEIIIAVDVSMDFEEVHIDGSEVKKRSTFAEYIKTKFLKSQIEFFEEFIMETKRFRLPHFMKKYIVKIVDRLFNPRRIYNYFLGRKLPEIIEITLRSMTIMSNQLYKEKLKNSDADLIIRPGLKQTLFSGFDDVRNIIKAGERATEDMMPKINKVLDTTSH